MARPNILFIVSDEERRNDWLDGKADLPAHDRLRRDGLSFTQHYTHASPCSPSRASLYTGRYLAQHGVVDNVSFPTHTELDPAIPTVGRLLGDAGYTSAYLGKWHLNPTAHPDLDAYGYADWSGNDFHYTGAAWTGRYFDPDITGQAQRWLTDHAADSEPWCLTVALVGPHDIMWYPADQPDHMEANPKDAEALEFLRSIRVADVPLVPPPTDYPERFDTLPANFDDDLHTKPDIQRAWRHVRNRQHFVGAMALDDPRVWLRQLDYYAWLHEELDANLVRLLGTLDELGLYDDTMIVYTSDHGDACGSHGLRAKLPCVYEEVMGVPLVVKPPTTEAADVAGRTTDALSTHVDLAATIVATGGADTSGLSGVDLSPVVADPDTTVRDHILFAQDSAQSWLLEHARYAVRGFFDGTTKYARYYGIGGGIRRDGAEAERGKTFDVDADFDDQDHEWYELTEDPHELVNLANDRTRRTELRENFARLLAYEAAEFTTA